MPRLPGRPCAHGECPLLVRGRGVRFCPQHAKLHQVDTDRRRGSASARGYGAEWRRVRDLYIAEHPTCERCTTCPAVLVHHIVRVRDGGSNESVNLESLCDLCHATGHARQHGLYGERSPARPYDRG